MIVKVVIEVFCMNYKLGIKGIKNLWKIVIGIEKVSIIINIFFNEYENLIFVMYLIK